MVMKRQHFVAVEMAVFCCYVEIAWCCGLGGERLERERLPGAVSSSYMAAATELGFRGSSFANWLWAL